MNYPLISEYKDAILSAEDNFSQLTHLRPVLDTMGNPVMSSGNFAVVFKMKDASSNRFYAVKCFLREQEQRAAHYSLIAEELQYVSSPYLLHMRYLERELFVSSNSCTEEEFPVIVMDWVEGLPLDKYLKNHLSNTYELQMLAYRFCKMGAWLLSQPFAHGDLKPDNILVRADGNLVLVDYDGMFVPAMVGRPAYELGSPDFRHPLRTESSFDEHIDDFAIATIALSLKVCAVNPALYHQYAAADRLLLSVADYHDIGKSAAMQSIVKLASDAELSTLLGVFYLALSKNTLGNLSFRTFLLQEPETPSLSTAITDEEKATAITDEYGAEYTADGLKLISVPEDLELNSYVIRQGTKVIADGAFLNEFNSSHSSLKSITIPDTIICIGKSAFGGCESLEFITIPKSVKSIGERAFCGCKSLESITIPDSVTSIGDSAFFNCSTLKSITILNCVTSIAHGTFSLCDSLKSITIPESVTSIGESAFYGCKSLESITIPDSVTSIGCWAFRRCESLKSIIIPNSVMSIGDGVFAECASLNDVIIRSSKFYVNNDILISFDERTISCWSKEPHIFLPDSVVSIGDGTFLGCESLKSITIPHTVTSIGSMAFENCKSLESIAIPNGVTNIAHSTFSVCDSLRSITIPESVTSIGKSAFYGCKSLESITIPDSVKSIGRWAFRWCESLESIIMPNSVTSLGDGVFAECASLNDVIIRSSKFYVNNDILISFDERTISCWSKEPHIILQDGVISIGDGTFLGCNSLKSITIPDSVTIIGGTAFCLCSSLQKIFVPKGSQERMLKLLGQKYEDKIVEFYSNPNSTTVTDEERTTAITDEYGAKYTADGLKLISVPSSLESYEIREGTKVIGDGAFYWCKALKSITIPDSVTSIGDSAFYWCESLESITIPNSITSIGNDAFCGCESLETITIPNSVIDIGEDALEERILVLSDANGKVYRFPDSTAVTDEERATSITDEYGAKYTADGLKLISVPSSLDSYEIREGTKVIGDSAFYLCESLKSITIPNSVTSIGDEAFYWCESLESITIPNSITSIGNDAFYGCESLEAITIPNSVIDIGEDALEGRILVLSDANGKIYRFPKPKDLIIDVDDEPF